MGLWHERTVLTACEGLENATLEYNRTSSALLQEEVLVTVLISRSPKEVWTYSAEEDTAKLGHVRQLLCDFLRAGKAWKTRQSNRNVVPMDVDALQP